MKSIYLVFDRIQSKSDGGLGATYANLVKELENDFEIKLVSVFKSKKTDYKEFEKLETVTLYDKEIDMRFPYYLFHPIKNRQRFLKSFLSSLKFISGFLHCKSKSLSILKGEIVIASSPAAALFLNKKIKYIMEVHTNYEYFWGNNPIGRLQSTFIPKPALTVFRNKSDSEKASSKFASDYIYNCFIPNIQKDNYPLQRKPHSALFVGRLVEEKNPLLLLKITEKIIKYVPDFTLDIYGDGPLYNTLQQEIFSHRLESNIALMGFTNDKSIYNKYDVLWLSSKNEGFGLVIIEAMASGTPTVSTEWGDAVYEIIENGKTGYISKDLNDFAEKSANIILNKALRDSLSKNCKKEFQEKFTAEKHRRRWLEIIDKVYS